MKVSTKKKIFIWSSVVVCLTVILLLGALIFREEHLNTQQEEAITQMLSLEGEYSDSSIILRGVKQKEAQKIADRLGADLRTNNDGSFSVLKLPEGITVKDVYTDPENRDIIGNMSLDIKVYQYDLTEEEEEAANNGLSSPNYIITEPDYSRQSYLDYINIGDVWNTTMGKTASGDKIKVAVIDSGIDTDHPEFFDSNGNSVISLSSYDATGDRVVSVYDNDLSIVEDENGHGTAVAGVLASQINEIGTVGVCPEIELIVIKCSSDEYGGMTISDVTFALYYAIEKDVSAVCMSFGASASIIPDETKEAFKLAYDSDIQIVAAAGNEGILDPIYPACDENVIGVGALADNSYVLADYSNFGDNVNIVAPGTTYTATLGGGYAYKNGTSMSAPIVTAAVALYMSQNKYTDCDTVIDHIQVSGKDLGDIGTDELYGHGCLDVNAFILEEKGTVTFDYGTSEMENDEYTFVRGHALHYVPFPEREYVVFDDWYYDKGYTKLFDYDAYYVETQIEDVTLYAKWSNEDDLGEEVFAYKVLDDGTAEITGYKGKRRHVIIPETIDGYTVTSVGDSAFSNNSRIRFVDLPDTLRSIGSSAFSPTGLINVMLNDGLETIGSGAFYETELARVTLPDSVISVGSSAFSNCAKLSLVNISENSALEAIGNFAFKGTRIRSFYIPKNAGFEASVLDACLKMNKISAHPENTGLAVINNTLYSADGTTLIYRPQALTEAYTAEPTTRIIGDSAFRDSRAVSVTLPEGVISIGSFAFGGAYITEMDIPDGVTAIGSYAFYDTSITKAELPDSVTELGEYAFSNSKISSIRLSSNLTVLPKGCFEKSYLTEVTIPDGVTSISIRAFQKCVRLENVTFGNGLKRIEAQAFEGCERLNDAVLPSGIESIGDSAFKETAIESVNLPASLNILGSSAFAECSRLTEVVFDQNCPITSLPSSLFMKCVALRKVVLTENITCIEDDCMYECISLHTVDLRGNRVLSVIGASAFSGTISLRSLDIPDALTELGDFAFMGSGIEAISFSENFTSYGKGALSFCYFLTQLTVSEDNPLFADEDNVLFDKTKTTVICVPSSRVGSYTLSDGVHTVGDYAFAGDSGLSEIILPESLVYINDHGFYSCAGLMSIHIPAGVKNIARFGFMNCYRLASVTFAENSQLMRLGYETFVNCGFTEFVVPPTVESMSQYVFRNCNWLTTVRFAAGGKLTSISAYMFKGCNYLKNVVFEAPTAVTSIQAHAFDGLPKLEGVDFGDAVITNIDNYSFFKCPSLETFAIPEGVTYVGRYSFYGCQKLKRIDLPSTVEFIGECAFAGNRELRVFLKAEKLPQTGDNWNLGISGVFLNVRDYVEGELWNYTVTYNDTAALVYYKGTATDIVLDEIDGYTVEKLGTGLFAENTTLKTISIADTVTEIDDYAFYRCTSLAELRLPASLLRIGRYAFANTSVNVDMSGVTALEEIDDYAFYQNKGTLSAIICDTVTRIGEFAFAESTLESVRITADSRLEEIGDGAFTASDIKEIYLPSGLKRIGDSAFERAKTLSKVTLSDGETQLRIGHNAFRYTAMEEVTIPARVYYIGEYAFVGCSALQNITVSEGNPSYVSVDGLLFNIDKRTLIQYPAGRAGAIEIPKEVEIITYAAFMDAKKITDVTFEEGSIVRTIGWNTFKGCTALRSISFPSTLYSIDAYAFMDCFALKEVVMAKDAIFTTVADGAFYNCISLKNVDFLETVTNVSDYAFYGCTGIDSLPYMPKINYIGDFAFSYTSIGEYTVPVSLEGISSAAFLFSELDNIYVEEGHPLFRSIDGVLMNIEATDVEEYFHIAMWPANRPFVIGEGLTEVTAEDTYNMPICAISELRFANTVTSIGRRAFKDYDNIYSVVIDGNVEFVGVQAFSNCSELRKISIGKNVNKLGFQAFFELYYLEEIYYNAETLQKMNDSYSLFDGAGLASGGVTVIFGKDVQSIPSYLFCPWSMYYKSNIRVIEFEEGSACVEVGENAFTLCDSIEIVYWAPKQGSFFDGFSQWVNVHYPTVMALDITDTTTEPDTSANYPYVQRITYKGVEYYAYSKHECELEYRYAYLPIEECVSNGIDLYTCSCGLVHHEDVYCHDESDYWITDKEPWCMEYGHKYTECVRCHISISESPIPYLRHEEIYHEAKDPTCTEGGWIAYSECTRCKGLFCSTTAETPFLSALGHSFMDWSCTVKPTCLSEGVEERYCGRCNGEHEERAVAKREHRWDSVYTYKIKPTCTASGTEYIKCTYSDCEIGKDEREAAPWGHLMTVDGVILKPTCTEEGLYSTKCGRSSCNETGTRKIEPNGHNLFHYEPQDPTCASAGHNAYEECRVCDYTTYEAYPAKGHSFGEWVVYYEPTCLNEGSRKRQCSVCGGNERESVAALGHTLTYYEAKLPTCTESGHEAYEECSACNHTTYVYLPPQGHPFGEWITDVQPGVGVIGHKYMPCPDCGITILEESIEPTGDITGFRNAMSNIDVTVNLNVLYSQIVCAITEYNALTDEEKQAAAELHSQLLVIVDNYNASAEKTEAATLTIVKAITKGEMRIKTVVAAMPITARKKEEL